MRELTKPQILEQNGRPAFAVIPFDEYNMLASLFQPDDSEVFIPHDVVKANVIDGVPMIKAWREHLGMTQTEIAEKAGMPQPSLARLERGDGTPRRATLQKLAAAMGIGVEQLEE